MLWSPKEKRIQILNLFCKYTHFNYKLDIYIYELTINKTDEIHVHVYNINMIWRWITLVQRKVRIEKRNRVIDWQCQRSSLPILIDGYRRTKNKHLPDVQEKRSLWGDNREGDFVLFICMEMYSEGCLIWQHDREIKFSKA